MLYLHLQERFQYWNTLQQIIEEALQSNEDLDDDEEFISFTANLQQDLIKMVQTVSSLQYILKLLFGYSLFYFLIYLIFL